MSSKSLATLESLMIKALLKANQKFFEMGDAGRELTGHKNQFGDESLKADIEIERAVVEELRKARLPIKIISEELKETIIGTPKYLGVMDGLDGSRNYREGKGAYSTIFSIFSNMNPVFSDYIFSGVMDHTTGRLFVAARGRGGYVIENGKRRVLKSAKASKGKIKIYVDQYFAELIPISGKLQNIKNFEVRDMSSLSYYADLIAGKADVLVECTGRRHLELAGSYGLKKELGFAIVDINGDTLNGQKYLEIGEGMPIISAFPEVASKVINLLKS